jgi:hypothetical protein
MKRKNVLKRYSGRKVIPFALTSVFACKPMVRHLERRLVILSAAKDLGVRRTRSFAALRMTART